MSLQFSSAATPKWASRDQREKKRLRGGHRLELFVSFIFSRWEWRHVKLSEIFNPLLCRRKNIHEEVGCKTYHTYQLIFWLTKLFLNTLLRVKQNIKR